MARIGPLAATLGSESASATEMPPRRPPQVSTGIAPLVKVRRSPSSESGTPTLINEGAYSFYPLWTHESSRITFSSDREGLYGIDSKTVGYADPPTSLLRGDNPMRTVSWSKSDGALLVREETKQRGMDILVFRNGETDPQPLLTSPSNELGAVVSPNGRWVAYVSDVSEQDEVYVTSYPEPGRRIQVSSLGGREPVWSPRGGELFFREGGKLVCIRYAGGPSFEIAAREELFDENFSRYRWHAQYDVHPDGDRFLLVQAPEGRGEIHLVQNWTMELERLTAEE